MEVKAPANGGSTGPNMRKRKKSVAEACRDAVTELEHTLWSYRDTTGEEWDAQPACFITDYLLAVQCFAFAVYITLFATNEEGSSQPAWYLIYFVALGISAAFGGLLHHVAFEAMRGFADKKKKSLVQRAKVFGFNFKRTTVDGFIDILWRIVLGFSILTNFALLSLAASRYLSESWAYTIIIVAGTCYIALAIWASINMHVLFLFVGYLPAMIFGAVTSAMAFDWEWSHPSNELLVYVLKLGSGLVQGLIVSPSKNSFNHNALSHVILSLAATFMLVHFKLAACFMLLFGGNLSSGVKKSGHQPRNANTEAEKADEGIGRTKQLRTESDVVTPRTDILHRLTNHELRLLEELERTRSKLQAEWRHKIADFQQQQGQSGEDAPTAIAEQLGLPRSPVKTDGDALKALMRSKTLVRSSNQSTKPILKHKKSRKVPNEARIGANLSISAADSVNLPRLRSSFDMLPILTTTGETPFELGLDSESSSSSRSPIQGQHVLPIFRLPTVNVVGAATVLAQKEVEMLEEDRDRKEASDALGLSLEEIAMLEAGLNEGGDQKKTAWSVSSRRSGDPNQNSPGHALPEMPSQQLKHATNRRHDKRQKCKADCRKLCNGAVRAQRGDSLRKELESALTNVQHLTRLVKDDIVLAQKICPANELRTSLYFKRWGRDKVENIFRRLLFNLQGIAFQRWHQVVAQEKQEEKLQAYLMYKGSKKLDHFLQNWSQRKLRQAWEKWWSDIVHVKALERLVVELDAIHVIQRAWQGYRGRMFAYLVKTQRLFAQQSAAATRIQRMFRGSVTRKFFRLKQLHKRRHIAATKIQAAGRGCIARQLARQMRRKRRHFVAASRIQAIYRGRKARHGVATLRRNRRVTQAALIIQRRYRGRLRRVKFVRRQMERYMAAAATKIQKIARGRRARRILRDLKEQARQRRMLEHASAIKIQKVYRSHRSRLSTELKLLALREKNRWRAKAATTIQKRMRSYLAKKCVHRVREAHAVQLVTLARTWVEYWNEDTSSWFYYNHENGEAIWTPPPTGYTKADGNLVLQNGKIIPDPLDGNISEAMRTRKAPHLGGGKSKDDTDNHQEEEHAHEHDNGDDDEDKLCVECEDEDACRRCDQCEDVFCDVCYEKLHRSSKREKHTWKTMGSLRCIECEKMKATRWCYVCQDPYCLGCFTIIHSKGNKVNHNWTDMSTFKKTAKQQQKQQAETENAQTYDEFMASHEYQYINELTADESAPQAVYLTEGEWMALVDESSGQTYYYNSYTGESRWA